MTLKLDPVSKARITSSSTPALRQLLHNHKSQRVHKTHAYAELLRRKRSHRK